MDKDGKQTLKITLRRPHKSWLDKANHLERTVNDIIETVRNMPEMRGEKVPIRCRSGIPAVIDPYKATKETSLSPGRTKRSHA